MHRLPVLLAQTVMAWCLGVELNLSSVNEAWLGTSGVHSGEHQSIVVNNGTPL